MYTYLHVIINNMYSNNIYFKEIAYKPDVEQFGSRPCWTGKIGKLCELLPGNNLKSTSMDLGGLVGFTKVQFGLFIGAGFEGEGVEAFTSGIIGWCMALTMQRPAQNRIEKNNQ